MKLNKLRWLSALVAFSLVSGLFVYLLISSDQLPKTPYFQVQEPVKPVAKTTSAEEHQITALTMKLAELQSHVLRLNALGDRLADEANIPDKEFNFQELPPSGGPATETRYVSDKSITEILEEIQTLEQKLGIEEKQLKMLESLTLGHHIENTSYLSGRPISKGWLSSYYGMRKDPFSGKPAMHKGIDFAGKEDGNILATAAGVVSWASDRYGYGQLVEINHGKGYKTRYGHNKKILVKVGDVVNKGQAIALMGSTGRSTGPHVHYEILKNDRQIDPTKYVYRKAK
ncbi:M23 family metallopeptidase [Thalassotalea sp. PLHSN55]|uniref:M23 family metallopeptidase n=1 Tax=Thalassotalea sp. PLHSN55 TaxID=3435888 RepID=UPI003F857372